MSSDPHLSPTHALSNRYYKWIFKMTTLEPSSNFVKQNLTLSISWQDLLSITIPWHCLSSQGDTLWIGKKTLYSKIKPSQPSSKPIIKQYCFFFQAFHHFLILSHLFYMHTVKYMDYDRKCFIYNKNNCIVMV